MTKKDFKRWYRNHTALVDILKFVVMMVLYWTVLFVGSITDGYGLIVIGLITTVVGTIAIYLQVRNKEKTPPK